MSYTPKTDAKAKRILEEFGPNNGGRFAAMCDFARELEIELMIAQKLLENLGIEKKMFDELISTTSNSTPENVSNNESKNDDVLLHPDSPFFPSKAGTYLFRKNASHPFREVEVRASNVGLIFTPPGKAPFFSEEVVDPKSKTAEELRRSEEEWMPAPKQSLPENKH